jgi:DNA-binding beta-propeller fold protein YncE
MKFELVKEYGPIYKEDIESTESLFVEPTYFEINSDRNITYIADKECGYSYRDNILHEVKKKFIGTPEYNSIVMNEQGIAYDYQDIEFCKWQGSIEIRIGEELFTYNYDPLVEPETIQLISKEAALLTLRKRQLVVLISNSGNVLWSFGTDMTPGKGYKLKVPIFSIILSDLNHILMCDALNSRVLEVNLKGEIVWQYGIEEELGSKNGLLWKPTCARRLADGTTWIADSKNRRIIQVKNDKVVHEIGNSIVYKMNLNYPRSIQTLPNQNWLITNTHKNNIFEINPITKDIVNIYDGYGFHWPRCAFYHEVDNEIIVGDGLNNSVVFIDGITKKLKRTMDHYHDINNKKYEMIGDPHHIDVNKENGNMLLTLSEVNQVVEITKKGTLIRKWSDLNDPHSAIYFDEGIIISNSNAHQIIVNYSDGNVIKINNFYNEVLGCIDTFNRPRFAVSFKGGLLILDTANQRIIHLHSRNNCEWIGSQCKVEYPLTPVINKFDNPRWIEVTTSGEILITDTENCRIMHLKLERGF